MTVKLDVLLSPYTAHDPCICKGHCADTARARSGEYKGTASCDDEAGGGVALHLYN